MKIESIEDTGEDTGIGILIYLAVAALVASMIIIAILIWQELSTVPNEDFAGQYQELNPNSQTYGKIEMPGSSIGEWSGTTYTILSDSEFTIIDGVGREVILTGPLVIEMVIDE